MHYIINFNTEIYSPPVTHANLNRRLFCFQTLILIRNSIQTRSMGKNTRMLSGNFIVHYSSQMVTF